MARENMTADDVRAVRDGLGETGSAWVKDDGGLYSKREENCDTVFHGSVADVDEARAVLDEPNHTPVPKLVAVQGLTIPSNPVKGQSLADAWAADGIVYLRDQRGAGCVHVDLYAGPEVTEDNWNDPEVHKATWAARVNAGKLAKRWRGLSYEEARAEFDAL